MSLSWNDNDATHAIPVAHAARAGFAGAATSSAYGADSLGRADHTAVIEQPAHLPSWEQKPRPALARQNELGLPIVGASAIPPRAPADVLTDRQRDVLQLIVQGLSNKEIARTLNVAQGTVKIHIAALFGKLGVHRRAAVAVAGARFLAPATFASSPAGTTNRVLPRTYDRSRLNASTPTGRNEREALRQIA